MESLWQRFHPPTWYLMKTWWKSNYIYPSSKGCCWAVCNIWWFVRQNWYRLWRQSSCLHSCESWSRTSCSYNYGQMFYNYVKLIAWQWLCNNSKFHNYLNHLKNVCKGLPCLHRFFFCHWVKQTILWCPVQHFCQFYQNAQKLLQYLPVLKYFGDCKIKIKRF